LSIAEPNFDYGSRVGRARDAMAERDIDLLLVSLGRDLPYLTGYDAPPLERLTMAVIPREDTATLVVPELEAARVVERPGVFELRPWGEVEDPVAVVGQLAGSTALAGTVAVGDKTWSLFLLRLQAEMPDATFVSAQPISEELRASKDDMEIALLRAAGAAADRVATRLAGMRFSGRQEKELSREISDMLVEEGHEAAGMAIVGSGPNGASPHHHAGERTIEVGDTVVTDFGGSLGGYTSDTTRMFHVGEPAPDEVRRVHSIVYRAQEVGFQAAGVGAPAQDVDRACRRVIADAGYGEYFIHRTGHGIGLEVHEDPYLVEGNETPLAPGMAFSIEPGIYLPGRFGVRIEDIVVMNDDGPERLNVSSRALTIVK
jgi:D-alanyl-D-alanine dipeptidase